MNGVLGALELLRSSSWIRQQRRLVKTAASFIESLMTILNDVLDHSKIAGKLNSGAHAAVVASPRRLVVVLFHANAEAKGLTLVLDVDPEAGQLGAGRRVAAQQVLLNPWQCDQVHRARRRVVAGCARRARHAAWPRVHVEGGRQRRRAARRPGPAFQPFQQVDTAQP